jgi:hypothetical protein
VWHIIFVKNKCTLCLVIGLEFSNAHIFRNIPMHGNLFVFGDSCDLRPNFKVYSSLYEGSVL